jgi:hypothetical protein
MRLLDFPPYALGSEVTLALELTGQVFEVDAMVTQILRIGSRRAMGLAFRDVSPDLEDALARVIRAASVRVRAISAPIAAATQPDDHTVTSLRITRGDGDRLAVLSALRSGDRPAITTEPWLEAASAALSTIEVDALRTPRAAAAWVHTAVLARMRVYELRARLGGDAPSEDDVRVIFGLCQQLADSARGAAPEMLVQVTNIRAEILRALYDHHLVGAT